MAEIRWTIQAADDIESIVNFISADSEHYARLLAVDILGAVERAGAFSESGRVVTEINIP
ncbi:type II toxin-antitoxin system RelE/ParE family toxin [bacterium]|nr:type II toxin-antitoxin system RelE/ParE family toxin [bacterium]